MCASTINPATTSQIHLAGMTSDLPVHRSCESEMAGLMAASHDLVRRLAAHHGPPALVTVAR